MADPMQIKNIIEKVNSGEIRIPSFQRKFVWTPEQVARLLDSIYKDIPIGSIFLWKTHEKLKTEKDFGNFELKEPEKDYPIKYVLDGQQRLTSLFTVFQTTLKSVRNNHSWKDIYFDCLADEKNEESFFVALDPEEVEPNRHFPMNVIFEPRKYMEANKLLDDDFIDLIANLYAKFQGFMLPVQEVETEDKGKIAIVFERINSAGTKLDVFQLVTAWAWSSEFDLQDEFDKLAKDVSKFGFEDIAKDKDLLLKCCAGIIKQKASPQAIMELDGETLRVNFIQIKNGIKGALNFLQTELNIESFKLIPYRAMIVSLSYFFATGKQNGIRINDTQRKELTRWFWKSCYSRRYKDSVTTRHERDLASMKNLKNNEPSKLADFDVKVSESFFTENQFKLGNIDTKVFILTLASKEPKSFVSGNVVSLRDVLMDISRNEFHHIFPRAHLQRLEKDNKEINMLANFCFLNNGDNNLIKDKSPSVYKDLITGKITEIMDSNLCPANALTLSYSDFVAERSKLLVNYVMNELINDN